jgi:hypothetical protein
MSTTGKFKPFCKRGHFRSLDSLAKNGTCKECSKAENRSSNGKIRWKRYREIESRKNYMKQYGTDYHLRKTFGISLEEYNQLLQKQENSCAICKTPQTQLKRALAVDHCHTAGKVRGLLCNLCNSMVLNVAENYNHLLPLAFDYLKQSN